MRTANSSQRMAGSEQFKEEVKKAKQPLGTSSDPFADVNRDKQQGKYDAYKDRGYDDLNNLETYKAQAQNNRLKEGGRFDAQDAAKNSMQANNFNFGGDLSGYDGSAAGNEAFDMQDVRYLQKSGASKEAIQKHIGSLENVHDSVRNHKQYGGSHYRGDMDKTKGIEQFDMGKGFNRWDISYLQKQGYDDKAITDYGVNSGLNHGASTAKFLNSQGRLDTRAKNTFDTKNTKDEYKYVSPDLSEENKAIDEEMNKDYWGQQVKREQELRDNDTDSWNSEEFAKKHINIHRKNMATRAPGPKASDFLSDNDDVMNFKEMERQINIAPLYDFAKSELHGLDLYGDKYRNMRENPNKWDNSSLPNPVESPDFDSIYNKTKKDLNSIKI